MGMLNGESARRKETWLSVNSARAAGRALWQLLQSQGLPPHTSAHFTTLCLLLSPLTCSCPETFLPLSLVATCEGETLK